MCPCDGTLTPERYAPAVERLLRAVDRDPELLLAPLVDRVETFALEHRYEEAAWARDRHRALVRTLERRRAWRALQAAGRIEAEAGDERAVIDGGRLVAAWSGSATPLIAPHVAETPVDVAPSVIAQEEVDLIWKWLMSPRTRLVDVSGALVVPRSPISPLDQLGDAVVTLNPLAVPASSDR